MTAPGPSNEPEPEAESTIVTLSTSESKEQLKDLRASTNPEQGLYSLRVLKTDEVDSIFPLPTHRAPGVHSWFISRVELTPAGGGSVSVWQKYHTNGISVKNEFLKFGCATKIQKSIGAKGLGGSELFSIKRRNDEGRDVWSVLRRSMVQSPANGSEFVDPRTTTDSTDSSLRHD
jgi:hypothetical protein